MQFFSFRGGKFILHLVSMYVQGIYYTLTTKGICKRKEKLLTKLLHLFKVKDLTDIVFLKVNVYE